LSLKLDTRSWVSGGDTDRSDPHDRVTISAPTCTSGRTHTGSAFSTPTIDAPQDFLSSERLFEKERLCFEFAWLEKALAFGALSMGCRRWTHPGVDIVAGVANSGTPAPVSDPQFVVPSVVNDENHRPNPGCEELLNGVKK